MANVPKAYLQVPTSCSNDWAALGPANAVIMYGDEVKAKARPLFRRLVESTATMTYA